MSFFGIETGLPRDRPNHSSNLGFSAPQDAWSGLSGGAGGADGGDDALDFETYDGLGEQLDDSLDVANDDTFGGGAPVSQKSVGKDFDFSGNTDDVARAFEEERMRFAAQNHGIQRINEPPQPAVKPRRTGYESYIPQLEADASIWGLPSTQKPSEPQGPANEGTQGGQRQMFSLEEVEAEMLRREQLESQQAPQTQHIPGFDFPIHIPHPPQGMGQAPSPSGMQYNQTPQILQRPRQQQTQQQFTSELPGSQPFPQQPQILQKPRQDSESTRESQFQQIQPPANRNFQTRHIVQSSHRLSGYGLPMAPASNLGRAPPTAPSHQRGPSYSGPPITTPQQILHLSEDERAAFLQNEARRAKRNHKIHLLSKQNGLMTPQDKNFITRIQLQQLVTATGSLDAQDPESQLIEDFYYQVYAQVRGASRANPHQPANQFAHTYLFQTGGRNGRGRARHGDTHLARMEQQVARAVEAAKARPKNKQLVLEGSLGKISFSNAKTPKPLLSFSKVDLDRPKPTPMKPGDALAARRAVLKNVESVYAILMKLEDHERQMPPPLTDETAADNVERHSLWREKLTILNQKLWSDLKVMEIFDPNSITQHPFIAMLSLAKGKKAMPRVFRHLDEQQRLTTITMIFVSLDQLDVISKALPNPTNPDAPIPPAVREEIDLFSQTVTPALYGTINEAPLSIIAGILGVVVDRTNVPLISLTKIGLSILTMVLSRAESLRESGQPPASFPDWSSYSNLFNALFDALEPALPHIFPGKVTEADDVHVWQFLAAMGVGANPEQQQRLVLGVKERVMETVGVSRTLPRELGEQRLGHVNLFMRAIGLDVELLTG